MVYFICLNGDLMVTRYFYPYELSPLSLSHSSSTNLFPVESFLPASSLLLPISVFPRAIIHTRGSYLPGVALTRFTRVPNSNMASHGRMCIRQPDTRNGQNGFIDP